MKIWIGDQDADTEGFALWLSGCAGSGRRASKGAKKLFKGLGLKKGKHIACKVGGLPAGSMLSSDAHVLYRIHGERIELRVSVFNEKRAPHIVRGIEAMVLHLQPAKVLLQPLPSTGEGTYRDYPTEGALFVRMIHSRTTPFQTIEVGEHPAYGRMLFLNGETQIASSDEALYSSSLVDPAFKKSSPKRVLILGGGDCGVLRQVLTHDVDEVVMVDIDGAVVETAVEYFPETVGAAREDPRARIEVGDAFEYLKTHGPFDLIVYDLSDAPLGDGPDVFGLIDGALGPKGRIAAQCSSALPRYAKSLRKKLKILEKRFSKVKTREVVIPSFLEQPWVFAFARKQGSKAPKG
jgi:spermidine synthase